MEAENQMAPANDETWAVWHFLMRRRKDFVSFRELATTIVESHGGDTDCWTEVAELDEISTALRKEIEGSSPAVGLASPFDSLLYAAISKVDSHFLARCLSNEVAKEEELGNEDRS